MGSLFSGRRLASLSLASMLLPGLVAGQVASTAQPGQTAVWDSFHGQLSAQKYSPLTQIDENNVGKLVKA